MKGMRQRDKFLLLGDKPEHAEQAHAEYGGCNSSQCASLTQRTQKIQANKGHRSTVHLRKHKLSTAPASRDRFSHAKASQGPMAFWVLDFLDKLDVCRVTMK